jgi:hypothetical protein
VAGERGVVDVGVRFRLGLLVVTYKLLVQRIIIRIAGATRRKDDAVVQDDN